MKITRQAGTSVTIAVTLAAALAAPPFSAALTRPSRARGDVQAGLATVAYAAGQTCNRQVGGLGEGVWIQQYRYISCKKARGFASALLHTVEPNYRHFVFRGYDCRYIDVHAGGGGQLCRRGKSLLRLDFE